MMSMWHPFGVTPHRQHVDPFFAEPFEVRAWQLSTGAAVAVQGGCPMPRMMTAWNGMRHMMTDTSVQMIDNAHMFGVQMDVSAYKPEEIDVKVRARMLVPM